MITFSAASIKSSALYWGKEEDVPYQGITLGLKVLSKASSALLLVSGKQKAEIFEKTIEGSVSTDLPATILQKRQTLIVVADKAAATRISRVRP